jgi:hypothetical protein
MLLDDGFGRTHWLTTWVLSVPVVEEGEYEIEPMDAITFENLLRQNVYNGNSALQRFAKETDIDPIVMLPARLPARDLLKVTLGKFEDGCLVVLRKAGKGKISRSARVGLDAVRIARDVDRLSHGKLVCDGRTYTLVAQGKFDGSVLGLTRQIVPPKEGLHLLEKMVPLHAAQPELAKLIGEAFQLLSTTTREIDQEPELILLRHLARPKPRAADNEPAMTPSQIARDLQRTWYEVRVVDEIGEPVSGIQVRIDVDGETHSGGTDADGLVRATGVPRGNATARFVDPGELLGVLDRRWSKDRSDDWIVPPRGSAVLEICRASSAWRQPVSLQAEETTVLVLEPPYWVRLFDEEGHQMASLACTVRVGDNAFDVTSDSQGWIEFPVGEQCPECAKVEWEQGGVRRSMEIVLNCHQGTPQDVAHARLWNLGFPSDDFEEAVRSFRGEAGFHDHEGALSEDERQEIDRRWNERIA